MSPQKNPDWYSQFEALRAGNLGAEDWASFRRRPQPGTRGLPPHEANQRAAMQEEYERLRLACQLFLAEYPAFAALEAEQTRFDDAYRLLKTLGVSAINLLDFPHPSVPLLEKEQEFGVSVERGSFLVFR